MKHTTVSWPCIKTILLPVVVLFAMDGANGEPAKQPPNVIVIVSDDHGYADAGFQGSKDIPTPHLDAMAKDGVRCTRGYVTAPVCSPTRAALLTGRYQQRFGHHNNIVAEAGLPIAHTPTDETLLPQVLGKAGYHTAMVGKWHLGLQDGCRPYERGFQEFFGIVTGGHDYFINHPEERANGDGSYKARIERNGPKGEKVPGYLTDAFGADAERIIRESHAKRPQQPLFMYLAFNAPHTPTQAPEDLVQAMPASLEGKNRRTYAAQIAAMDRAIGRMRAALKDTGMDRNTFIIFFSDNGGAKYPYYDNTPLRNHKGSLYEGGIRVPFLAVLPGRIPAGRVCDVPVTSLDVFATACALAGVTPQTTKPLDSKDMLPVLTGASEKATHPTLYWDIPATGQAVADGDLKLILPRNGKAQLFDLSKDIGEKQDLADQRPDEVKRLTALLEEWRKGNVKPLWGLDSTRADAQGARPAGREKLFRLRDANQDGKITKEEFMAAQKNPDEGAKRFTSFDKNQDGALDRTEFIDMGK